MNKRDAIFNLINGHSTPGYTPAAFFLHFGTAYQQGQEAIDKHLEFFHTTGMDFVKIQYEQTLPPMTPFLEPSDWFQAPRCSQAFYEPTLYVVDGLVKAAKSEAPVILTIYSPFMLAGQLTTPDDLGRHLRESPDAVKKGLDILTENVLTLIRACKQIGIDGFYVSSQGGEAFRFPGTDIFRKYIKPIDLAIWAEIEDMPFNILHVCDYNGPYDDLSPFIDYPGHVVNCSLQVGGQSLSPKQVSEMFQRPFMGGMERKGILATGSPEDIHQVAMDVLEDAPERFILAADCTVPSETPWDNLKAAIDVAHQQ